MAENLSNKHIYETYHGLIKTGDNLPLDGTLKTLSDGDGNDLPIAVSTDTTKFKEESTVDFTDVTIIGAAGMQGPQGSQGPQGPQGIQGFQGANGANGAQGSQGFQGSNGSNGAQGAQGPRGFQGFQGIAGVNGAQGSVGAQGVQGPRGFQGFQGANGANGAQGTQGFQGSNGIDGTQGPQGIQGAQGEAGPANLYVNESTEIITTRIGNIPVAINYINFSTDTNGIYSVANQSISMGFDAANNSQDSIYIGRYGTTGGSNSIVLGMYSYTNGDGDTIVGNGNAAAGGGYQPGTSHIIVGKYNTIPDGLIEASIIGTGIVATDSYTLHTKNLKADTIKVTGYGAVVDYNGYWIGQPIAGTPGPQGPAGPQGSIGAQGPQGFQGINGIDGAQGAQGFQGPGFDAVTNPLDNRVLTSDGTATGANAEANMTFDGTTLDITGNVVADKLGVDITVIPVLGVGEIGWNDVDGTLEFVMKGGNVTQQIGQELPILVKHADNTGLIEGKVVYTVGSDGTNMTVRYASNVDDLTSSTTFGVMTESASGGAKAFCTTFGLVRGLNTLSLTEGAPIWLGTNGDITTTKPVQPEHLVYIGVCVRSHATQGVIFVKIQNGYELNELHDVQPYNPLTLANNSLLVWNSTTKLWEAQTGITGPQGPQGIAGTQGPQGPAGGGGGSSIDSYTTIRGIQQNNASGVTNIFYKMNTVSTTFGTGSQAIANNVIGIFPVTLAPGQIIDEIAVEVTAATTPTGTVTLALYKSTTDANGNIIAGELEKDFGTIDPTTAAVKAITGIAHTLGSTVDSTYWCAILNTSGVSVTFRAASNSTTVANGTWMSFGSTFYRVGLMLDAGTTSLPADLTGTEGPNWTNEARWPLMGFRA